MEVRSAGNSPSCDEDRETGRDREGDRPGDNARGRCNGWTRRAGSAHGPSSPTKPEERRTGTKPAASPDSLGLYEKLVDKFPEVERKGAKMPYTSLNGHMFSFLTESGAMAPRLPEDELAALLKKCRPWLRERHGTVLKDHAVVPASLLEKTADLAKWFLQSTKYVASLTPEATRKNTKAKKSTKAKKTARASKKQ